MAISHNNTALTQLRLIHSTPGLPTGLRGGQEVGDNANAEVDETNEARDLGGPNLNLVTLSFRKWMWTGAPARSDSSRAHKQAITASVST